MAELVSLVDREQISLAEVLAAAPATTRVDRKYLVRRFIAEAFLVRAPESMRVLAIEGRLATTYRSTYFDTADLATCRAHVQGRRLRWKARSRLYVEDALCRLELKVRDGHGLTHKIFHPTTAAEYGHMTDVAESFFHEQLLRQGMGEVRFLEPAVEVGYERATLADTKTGTRVTIDSGVRCTRRGQTVEVDAGLMIVETKGSRRIGAADRLLIELGARPVSFSKYAASASLMDPNIADNDIRRMVGRELHLTRAEQPDSIHRLDENLRRTA